MPDHVPTHPLWMKLGDLRQRLLHTILAKSVTPRLYAIFTSSTGTVFETATSVISPGDRPLRWAASAMFERTYAMLEESRS